MPQWRERCQRENISSCHSGGGGVRENISSCHSGGGGVRENISSCHSGEVRGGRERTLVLATVDGEVSKITLVLATVEGEVSKREH